MTQPAKSKFAIYELHLAVFLFGISGLFGKLIAASPSLIVVGRTAFAAIAIFLGLKILSASLRTTSRKATATIFVSGIVLALHWHTFFYSIQISTVAIGLVGFATFPIFVTFLEPILTSQPIRKIDIASAIAVMIGLVIVAPSFDLSDSGTIGLVWAVVSGALFAVLTLMNRQLVKSDSFLVVALYQHSSAALVLLPFVLIEVEAIQPSTILLLMLLGVVCTALPQTLFIKSLKYLKAQFASIVTGLEPVYGIIFAAMLLNEIPSMMTILGSCLVFGAVVIAMKAHEMSGGAVPRKKND